MKIRCCFRRLIHNYIHVNPGLKGESVAVPEFLLRRAVPLLRAGKIGTFKEDRMSHLTSTFTCRSVF